MSLPRQLGHGVMSLPSHADDVAIETTWSRRDVVVESYCAIKVRIYDRSCDVRSELGCTCIISMYNG
jgi:hypothetical protein